MVVKAVQHHKPKAAAAIAGCSLAQLYILIARGDLNAVKLGGSTLIRDDDLAKLLDGLPRMQSRMKVPGTEVAQPDQVTPRRRGRPSKTAAAPHLKPRVTAPAEG